jgi:hypothetical protein
MKKVSFTFLIFVFLLALVSGCSKREVNKEDILTRLESSLETQGFTLNGEGKQSDRALQNVYPYKYILNSYDPRDDYILVYIFNEKNEVKQAIENQHYTITTLTNFENYTNENVLVVYFATSGLLDPYGKKIEAAVKEF